MGIGAGVLVLAVLLLIFLLYRRRRKHEEPVTEVEDVEIPEETATNFEDEGGVYTNPLDHSGPGSEGLDEMVFSGSDANEAT
jgi:hypothetical protein